MYANGYGPYMSQYSTFIQKIDNPYMFPPPYGQQPELYPSNPPPSVSSFPPTASSLPGQGQYPPPIPPPAQHYMGTPYEYNYGYFPPNYPPYTSSSV